MTNHRLGNGQTATVGAAQWNADSLTFAGTSAAPGLLPGVTFTGVDYLATVNVVGTAAAHAYGSISLVQGGSLTTGGMLLSHATLTLNERPFLNMTFSGVTTVSNGSALTADGFAGQGIYTVNGVMNIDGTSTVSMDSVAVSGSGTFHLSGSNALLRAGRVSAGETVKLDGGMLSLSNGLTFLGTITDSSPATSRIGAGATVAVYSGLDAVRETFNRTTGVLDLFDAQGNDVVHLKFAGHGDLFVAPTSGLATNYLDISSQHTASALPVTFLT